MGAGRARLLGAAAQPEGHRGVRVAGAGTAEQAAELKASAERLALAVGYRGAGTVEFLYHPGEKLFAFLEVNTRLQVEHPITEITTGIDLVKAQLHVAAGGRLEGAQPAERGHAIEARLNAEDPDRDFAPSPGRIARLDLPAGPGIRVDTGVSEGDTIPADFDSMIAKIIAYGRDRDEALGRLRRAMAETTVIIEGGATNKSFVLDLLDQPEVIDASADTGWIDRVRAEGRLVSHRHSAVALAAAAIEAYEDEEEVERQRLLSTAHGGRPQVQHESGRPLDLKLRGAGYRVRVARDRAHRFRVGVSGGATSHPPTSSSSASTSTPARSSSTGTATAWSPTRTARSTWSRSTASPTGSAATRAASCAPPRPRWSSPRRWRSAPRSRRARRCWCWRA